MNKLASVLLVSLLAPVTARAEKIEAPGLAHVELRAQSSDLEVEPGEAIAIEGAKHQLERAADRLIIRVVGSDRVRLTVPPGLSLEISTKSGDVKVKAAVTRLSISTVSGDVVAGAADEMEIETLSGDIRLE